MYIPFISKKKNQSGGSNSRLAALIIDTFIIMILLLPISLITSFGKTDSRSAGITVQQIIGEKENNIKSVEDMMNFLTSDAFLSVLQEYNMISIFIMNLVIQISVFMLYEVLFWWKKQTTPGGMIFGFQLVDYETKLKPSLIQCIVRFLVGILNFFTLGIGFFLVSFNKEERGLHDYISGTQLIKKSNKEESI